jgi:multisubunit Na+/H+ antiporter MnhF subunit
MTPLDFLVFSLAVGVLAGVQLVARGGPENSLIGLNVAVICVVTELVILHQFYGLVFSRDIAFYLLFPGVFGVIIYAKFLRGGLFK